MTGEKNRYKTHEQLWKLEDGDLSTSKHDDLILPLLEKKNALKLIELVGCSEEGFILEYDSSYEITLPQYHVSELGLKTSADLITHINNAYLISKCEVPVVSRYNRFIIGYLDIQYKIRFSHSFIEPMSTPREVTGIFYNVNIEVKPTIRNFGETLRQINTYKQYLHGMFVLYSPDTRFKEAFKSQGIIQISPSDIGL